MKLHMLYSYLTAREISTLVKYRNSHGILGRLPHEVPLRKVTEVISPSIIHLDFPFLKPSNVRLYGPIVLDSVPVQDLDLQLSNWLDTAPTVLISMGTHFTYTRAQVRAVLRGFLTAPKNARALEVTTEFFIQGHYRRTTPGDRGQRTIRDYGLDTGRSVLCHDAQKYRGARSPWRGKFILRSSIVSRESPGVFLILINAS